MRTKLLYIVGILLSFYSLINGQDQSSFVRQPLFNEPFNDNSNEWIGIGVRDQQGSAKIIENKYCEVIAPRDSSMIIANEQEIDTNRDFEISCGFRMASVQAKAYNNTFSFSWGCSFENMNQYCFSLSPSKYFSVRNYSDEINDIVPPRLVNAIDPKNLNIITIQKKGGQYSFFINHQFISSAPFTGLYGGGIVMTVGSGLTVLVDYLSIDYLVTEEENQALPFILLDAPFANSDKTETTSPDIVISGNTIGNDIKKMAINGSEVGILNGKFSYKAQLIAGINMFKLETVNNLGVSQVKHVEILRTELPEKLLVGQKRLALIIGNSKYTHSAPLKNPSRDALDMAKLLKGIGFEVMCYTDLDYQSFNNALKDFGREITRYDVTMVFYAGHGIQIDGKNYMLPIDAQLNNKNDVAFEAVDVDKVMDILAESDDDKLNLLILDACRNNPFKGWSRGGPEGLAGIHPPSGVLVAYSTSPGSYASDGTGQNGLYTEELMKQLNISQRVEDIFINTRIAVEKRSNGSQSPWELARLRGKYYLK